MPETASIADAMIPLPSGTERRAEDFDFDVVDVFFADADLEVGEGFPLAVVRALELALAEREAVLEAFRVDVDLDFAVPLDADLAFDPAPVDLDFEDAEDLLGVLFLAAADLPEDEEVFEDRIVADPVRELEDLVEPDDLEDPDFEPEDLDEPAFEREDLEDALGLEVFLVVAIFIPPIMRLILITYG